MDATDTAPDGTPWRSVADVSLAELWAEAEVSGRLHEACPSQGASREHAATTSGAALEYRAYLTKHLLLMKCVRARVGCLQNRGT